MERKIEREHVEALHAMLNRAMPSRTKSEWTQDNKDHVKQYKHEWHKENKEINNQKKKFIENRF